jgi:hypothetical protein
MTFTYDLTTSIGLVRLLIPDCTESKYSYEDEEIAALLAMPGTAGNPAAVYLAAAQALDGIGTSEVRKLKYITVNKTTTNGPPVGKYLSDRAATLRAQAQKVAAEGMVPVIVSQAVDEFTAWNLLMRSVPE